MKLCIPLNSSDGLASEVSLHFGGAAYFMIYDAENSSFEILDNTDKEHAHGMCSPLEAIKGRNVSAVIVGGIGVRALKLLKEGGIKVYRSGSATVGEEIKKFSGNKLKEVDPETACTDHKCDQ